MPQTAQQTALDVLEASLDLSEPERSQLLAAAAAADSAVGTELRRLENAHTCAGAWLRTDARAQKTAGHHAAPPAQIGAYRVERLIGKGGMGAVYSAARSDGLFEKRVAIKLLSRRTWSSEMEARFADERRILARLEHRNIAPLFDGGVSSEGHSYIVMELIDGASITAHCEAGALALKARLGLFGQLCTALQYAHQQLVVHADIKPSNVLVTRDGSVKLLDFGIAQLISATATASSHTTGSPRDPITLAYAAPERQSGGAPSVAGDVYSLGVVLRDLLGRPPDPRSILELLAIVDKAMAYDPRERYGSVSELWEDISRWLQKLPVRAYQGGWGYRANRFVARNSTAVMLAILTILVLSIAAAVSFRLYVVADRARDAEASRFREARELNANLVEYLSEQMLDRPGMVEANWPAMANTLGRLEDLARSNPRDVVLQIELGRSIARVASNVFDSNRPRDFDVGAVRSKLAAQEQRLAALGEHNARADYWAVRSLVAQVQSHAANALDGDAEAAVRQAKASLSFAERARQLTPDSEEAWVNWLTSSYWLAAAWNADGHQREAILQLDKTQTEWPGAALAATPSPRVRHARVFALQLRCDIKRWLNADAAALQDCRAADAQLRNAIVLDGPLVTLESRHAYTLFLIATLLPQPSQSADALTMLEEAQRIYARVLHFGHNELLVGESLVIEAARAQILTALGRTDEARAVASNLLAQRRARLAAEPQNHGRRREVATALRRVGEVELAMHNTAAACVAFGEAGAIWDQMQREGRLHGFDLAPRSGQVPWIRERLARCR